jgi:hypothetical protein
MMNAAELAKMIETLKELEGKLKNINLSAIEKDLLLEKIRNLYEAAITITAATVTPEVKQEIPVTREEEKPAITVTQTTTTEPKPAESVAAKTAPEPVEEIIPVAVKEEEKKEIIKEEPVITPSKKQDKKDKSEKTNAGTLSDRFIVNHHSTVGEMMNSMRSKNDLTSQLRQKPVSNLKNAISINDRIMFARELFKGDNDLFHNTVDEINKLKQLDEAMELISDRMEMDPKNPAVEKFMELLYRRFITTDDSLK